MTLIDLSLANGGYHYGGSFSWPISWSIYSTMLWDRMIGSSLVRVMGVGFITFYLEGFGFNPLFEGHPHYDPSNGVFCYQVVWVMGFPLLIGHKLKETEEGTWYCLCPDR